MFLKRLDNAMKILLFLLNTLVYFTQCRKFETISH